MACLSLKECGGQAQRNTADMTGQVSRVFAQSRCSSVVCEWRAGELASRVAVSELDACFVVPAFGGQCVQR
jgi:hypothetical protein